MSVIKSKFTYLFIIIFILSGMISCNKQSKINEQITGDDVEMAAVNEGELMETDEDLLKVDYREFYDELAPHGEWIEVTDKDIDAVMNGTSSNDSHRKISFADLFGVKDAHATTAAFGAFFVWRPSPELAVSIVAGEPEPVYVPYTRGRWINTDAGWYFLAATDYEEITHHHGRWVHSPVMGWVWVPGRVWAPAWVDWREDDNYLAWEPLPPRIYIVNDYIVAPPVYVERYVIVEKRFFYSPDIYNYIYTYQSPGINISITNMRPVEGIVVVNNTIINRGPSVSVIETYTGSRIEMVKVNKVRYKGDFRFTGTEIYTYSPQFTKIMTKEHLSGAYFKPHKYDKYNEFKSKKESRNEVSGDNKGKGIEDKRLKTEKRKYSDDGDMKNGKVKEKQKNRNYDRGNKQKDNKQKGYNKDKGGKNKNDGGYKRDKGGKNKNDGGYKKDKGGKNKNDGGYKNDKGGKNKNDGGNKNKGKDKGGKNKNNFSPGKDKPDRNIDKGKDRKKDSRIKGKDNSGNKNDRKSKEYFKEKKKESKPPRDKSGKDNNQKRKK